MDSNPFCNDIRKQQPQSVHEASLPMHCGTLMPSCSQRWRLCHAPNLRNDRLGRRLGVHLWPAWRPPVAATEVAATSGCHGGGCHQRLPACHARAADRFCNDSRFEILDGQIDLNPSLSCSGGFSLILQ